MKTKSCTFDATYTCPSSRALAACNKSNGKAQKRLVEYKKLIDQLWEEWCMDLETQYPETIRKLKEYSN